MTSVTRLPAARRCASRACGVDVHAREVALGLRLCPGCRTQLARQLAGLPALYQDCAQDLCHHAYHGAERLTGWWPGGISLNDAVMTVRSEMTGVLVSWCQLVVGERGLIDPGHLDFGQQADFLRTHLKWLASHAAAGEFAAEVAGLFTAAGNATDPSPGLTLDLGPCAEPGCDRILRATIGGPGESSAHDVHCDAGHSWAPAQWLLLGRRIEQAKHRLADAPAGQAVT
jgi:hypothetical protein